MVTFKNKFLFFSSLTFVIVLLATPLHAGKRKVIRDSNQPPIDSFFPKVKKPLPQNEPKRQRVEHKAAENTKLWVAPIAAEEAYVKVAPHVPTPAPVREKKSQRAQERNLCKITPIHENKHLQLLKNLINSANEEILITTESIGYIPDDIVDSLRRARDNDVTVKVYSNQEPSEWVRNFFEKNNINYELLNIHGKHLIIDRSCAVIGSCNWLGFSDEGLGDGERSIKISGNPDYIKILRGCIWSTIINYRKIYWAKMNDEPTTHIKLDKSFLNLSVNTDSRALLLTTLPQHEDYLKFICREAKKRITIYSPFITYSNAVKRLDLIAAETKKGVKLRLFLNEYDLIERTREGYDLLSKFIETHPKLKEMTRIHPLNGFHCKTLIVDNETRSEGSFNWLSSALSAESDFHNQDTSIVIQGPIVRDLFHSAKR